MTAETSTKNDGSADKSIVATQSHNPPVQGRKNTGVMISSAEELWVFAKTVSGSGLVPKSLRTPQDVFVAVQSGMEVGLAPMAALRSMAVINGRPSLFGDALLGVCYGTGLVESFKEELQIIEGDGGITAVCSVKRRGIADIYVSTFSVANASRAGLLPGSKGSPWASYPERMLKMRARGFALRDAFADVLSGVGFYEEQADIERCNSPVNVTPTQERSIAEILEGETKNG